jgi:hypothetical protein
MPSEIRLRPFSGAAARRGVNRIISSSSGGIDPIIWEREKNSVFARQIQNTEKSKHKNGARAKH